MIKRLGLLLFLVVLALTISMGARVWRGWQSLNTPVQLDAPVLFSVSPGEPLAAIARDLAKKNLIRDENAFIFLCRLQAQSRLIKAGEYEVLPETTARQILTMIIAGQTKNWSVQFIEGKTFADARQRLAKAESLQLLTSDWTDAMIMEKLGQGGTSPEGLFFPDTYRYQRGDSDLDLLRKAYTQMAAVLDEEWQQRDAQVPYATPYQALIMASIIEKETGVVAEMPEIAGVFVRRLQQGMRLQTDPTVIYGLGDRYHGNLKREHLLELTPFNTYKIDGLPPTPIAMPGRAAIHAALHPAPGSALFFVARGDGSHAFTSTLSEHEKAVREYQLKPRTDYRSAPPAN